MGADDGKMDMVSMNMNPLQKKMLEKEAAQAAAAALAFQLKEMEDQQKGTKKKGRGKKRTIGNKKKQVAGNNDDVIVIGSSKEQKVAKNRKGLNRTPSFSKIKDSTTGKEYYHNLDTNETVWTLPANGVVVEPHTKKKKKGSKKKTKDKTVNIELGSVSSGKNGLQSTLNPIGVKKFSKQLDSATGRHYYHNTEDGTTSWTKPPDDEIIIPKSF